ncbi:hypothetical protein O181_070235 [Austropuccinia psidii MF-1]|uniref:Reverse transcriptase/retrotransposon-derived protein RNase H-like domain-containing protein n=1 Tax=Austropuccinia psidii MF-1 TaxID=1389203 RepID=A0A9Q3EW22_9BASI|nr:hypothetical protein [Austropuccinia psidii MF-1]
MDLPLLYLHASLEEPEENETFLKVVSPSFHQYLDVFAKMKAEKIPPNHVCDNHIELEGLLPPEALSQFQILKEAFTTAPILSHFNPSLQTMVETDASDYALGSVLSQVNSSGKHLIEFDSCKLLNAELNCGIHDKELLGIVWALKNLRDVLFSLHDPFEVLTDHSSLQSPCCQAHWAEFLSEFHCTFSYFPGRLATITDALSHWDNVYPERGVDFVIKNPRNFHQVLKQKIQESTFFSIKAEMFSDLVDQIKKEVWQDKEYKGILK